MIFDTNKVRKFYVLYRDLESNLIYLFLNEEYSEKKFSIFTHVRNAKQKTKKSRI